VSDPTASDYALAAKYALRLKQLPRAVQQISGAIALEPEERKHRAVLGDILLHSRSPLQLLVLHDSGAFYGLAAARGWFLLQEGKWEDGLLVLEAVLVFRPNLTILRWLDELARPFAVSAVRAETIARLLTRLLETLKAQGLHAGGKENLEIAMRLASTASAQHPQDGSLLVARCQALRAMGAQEQALSLARGQGTWEGWVAASWIHRGRNHLGEEIDCLRKALAFRPGNAETLTDLALALAKDGNTQEASQLFEQAVTKGAEGDALSFALYFRALAGEDGSRTALCTKGTRRLSEILLRDLRAYETELPDPLDATVRAIRGVLTEANKRPEQAIRAEVVVPGLVAPSAELAFCQGVAAQKLDASLQFCGERTAVLWPELACSEEERARVEHILVKCLHSPFAWDVWLEWARAQGEVETNSLFAILIDPPNCPAKADPVQWLVHVHCAVGMLLGQQKDAAKMVELLLRAEHDWLSCAGLIALVSGAETVGRAPGCSLATMKSLASNLGNELPVYSRTLAILGMKGFAGSHDEVFRQLRVKAVMSIVADFSPS